MGLWCDVHLTASEKCEAMVGCHLTDSKFCEARLRCHITQTETHETVRFRPIDSEIYEARMSRHLTYHDVNRVTMEGCLTDSEIC